jgi:hypothetical protein
MKPSSPGKLLITSLIKALAGLTTLLALSCSGGSTPPGQSDDSTHSEIEITWSANRESAVNGPGGGYIVFYSTRSGFEIEEEGVVTMTIPYESGPKAPTSLFLTLASGSTTYFRVLAYSPLTPTGSEPSAEVSFTIP